MGSCGIVYTIMQDLDLVVGYSYLVTYDGPEKGTTPSGYEVSYDRTVQNIAIGVNYKVF
jgi:long-subunit fatty acid transport protein